ncbi:MAG: WecB/TagA/CpsF family glycosyltransferase [Phascolarctobacterium sp.]|uniref:WecB/TagA/CpsF family glycosyltransferase n=1 Tax=Phascolarctobacterium sp. TaxID=2049039 RepID=UPI0026DC409A|nr:WecB/TagA/CpsF family glycosyltransferase [Phascolarctobacterium sp.]MDO4921065.1 WecB/TagA/CpsF family glycosyltransferase [Phascolarctobacterium sp.]
MQEPIKILGVPVHPLTMRQSVDFLEQRMLAREQTFVVTANAEIIMMCQEDAGYNKIVSQEAELVLPDGAGAVWAGRYLGYQVPERVAGFDLFNHLLALAAKKGYKAFFFGGSPGVAEAAKAKSESLYPGVQVAGCHNGYFTEADEPAIIEAINASGADMLFVALGAPKQEKWLLQHRAQLRPRILMGIGGSFDVFAGKMERAPKWMQDASLEWAFRLYKQPSRFIRMLALPKFVLKVIFSGK